jgi:ATP-binding cassette subfamily F protein 3
MWAKERRLADEQSSLENQKNSDTIETNKITDAKQQARESAKLQKQLSNKIQRLKKDIEAKENEIAELESSISEVEGQLAAPPEGWSPAKIAEVAQEHSALNAKLDEAMQAWEDLNAESQQTSDELNAIRGGK